MKKSFFLLATFVACLSFQSCTDKKDSEVFHYSTDEYELLSQSLDLPEETHNYTLVTNRPVPGFNPDLPFHKATLGRVLFYDKELSVDGSTSCASCHKQAAAFADNEKFSEGLEGNIGTRNSLPLGNTIGFVKYYGTDLSFQSGFFSWDERFESINQQSEAAITSSFEMGHSMWELATKIKADEKYQVLFDKAYGDSNPITEANILDAITEFVNSFSSRASKFDKSIPAPPNTFSQADVFSDFEAFSSSENNGKSLFNTNCSSCHGSSHNAIIRSSANNGLDMVYADKGLGDKDGESYLDGVFKVPSLRNIELTGPYMHDGRFSSLEEVVDHYSDGVQSHPNLSEALRNIGNNQAVKFNFSSSDKEDLVNYLRTLTDTDFVTAPKWSDPFK
ncbi:MAG: cytochrome c peroxidase [Saprospiraceae bacterium]|jgi:cytochrome c peroxidase